MKKTLKFRPGMTEDEKRIISSKFFLRYPHICTWFIFKHQNYSEKVKAELTEELRMN